MIHTIQGIVEAAKGGQGGIIAVAAAQPFEASGRFNGCCRADGAGEGM